MTKTSQKRVQLRPADLADAEKVHELRGLGLGQAALREVIQLACHDWGLHRLGANCLAINQASIRCLERVGFVQEGVMQEAVLRHGQYQDLRIYGYIHELQ